MESSNQKKAELSLKKNIKRLFSYNILYESGFFSIGLSIFKMEYPLSYDVLFKKIKILARYEEMILDIINTPGDITENEIQDQLLS